MSLNKITTSTDYLEKQYLNIGCNDIKCSSLEIGGISVIPSNTPVSGKYNATIDINVSGSDDLDGWIYYEAVGNQLKLQFSRLYQLGNNASLIIFTIDLPNGYTTQALTAYGGVAYTTDSNHTSNMTQVSSDGTGTKIIVTCNGNNNLSSGTAFFNGSLVIEI